MKRWVSFLSWSLFLHAVLAAAVGFRGKVKNHGEVSFQTRGVPVHLLLSEKRRPQTSTMGIASLPSSEVAAKKAEHPSPVSSEDVYLSEIQRLIADRRKYPEVSIRLREQGIVRVSFELDADGNLGRVELESTSDYERLDRAALNLVQSFTRFPRPPDELFSKGLKLSLPIAYRLH